MGSDDPPNEPTGPSIPSGNGVPCTIAVAPPAGFRWPDLSHEGRLGIGRCAGASAGTSRIAPLRSRPRPRCGRTGTGCRGHPPQNKTGDETSTFLVITNGWEVTLPASATSTVTARP